MSEDHDRSDASLWVSLWPFLKRHGRLYALALALAPFTAILVALQPWLLQQAIDRYITPGDLPGLQRVALFFLAAVVTGFLTETGHTLALSYAAMRTITDVRRAVYTHTLKLAQRHFDRTPTGRLLTRATNDVEALGETLTAGALTIFMDICQVTLVLGAMLWLDARLTLALLLVGPPLALVVELLRRRLRTLYHLVRTSLSDLNAYLSERLEGIPIVQLYRDEARTLAMFDERLYRYRDATIRTNVFDALMYATVDGFTSITLALMLWYGSGGLFGTVATAGVLAAFIEYVNKLFRPIQELSAKIAVIQRAGAALSKIFGLLETHEHIHEGTGSLPAPRGHVALEHVTFAYGDGPPVLSDVSLELQPGEVVALVGRTGSGKTTIGKLLTRAYEGWTGRITLDGVPLQELPTATVRHAIGSVHQDVQLFPGDVRFNLTLGRDIDDATLREAIRLVRAEAVVQRLGGLDGHIEEGGRNLSSGEAQLLSFARTMAYDPQVVILDEATASVDSLTEARIQDATDAILAAKTTLVIAHRLSTIVHADRIAVLEKGRIVELGNHATLLAADGRYAELFRQQFQDTPAEA
ncbi:MAG: ABC transporter ATP-binding protein [Alphaproteobacteria bacterium]|nr:ABC transporter ATP-binding protein [Alphaproteobacteria bacterium]